MAPKGPPPGYINPRLVSDKLHPDHPYSLANYKKRQSERMKEAMKRKHKEQVAQKKLEKEVQRLQKEEDPDMAAALAAFNLSPSFDLSPGSSSVASSSNQAKSAITSTIPSMTKGIYNRSGFFIPAKPKSHQNSISKGKNQKKIDFSAEIAFQNFLAKLKPYDYANTLATMWKDLQITPADTFGWSTAQFASEIKCLHKSWVEEKGKDSSKRMAGLQKSLDFDAQLAESLGSTMLSGATMAEDSNSKVLGQVTGGMTGDKEDDEMIL